MGSGSALTGKTGVSLFLEYLGAAEIGTPKVVVSRFSPVSWTRGETASAIEVIFQDQRTTDNTGETLNIYDSGTLLDCFGNALTIDALKFLYLKNTHATLVLEVFGNAAADLLILSGTTDALEIPPGGEFYWSGPTAGGIVTSTNKNLFIKSKTAGTISYDIILGGYDE